MKRLFPVASLGWVSPGAATVGVTPIFPEKKLATFLVIAVSQFSGVNPIYFLLKNWRPFCSSLSLLLISFGCHPPGGCHPGKIGVTPTVAAPGETHPSDATGNNEATCIILSYGAKKTFRYLETSRRGSPFDGRRTRAEAFFLSQLYGQKYGLTTCAKTGKAGTKSFYYLPATLLSSLT